MGTPTATTASSTAADASAKSVVRAAGTASMFQMPPRPARLPMVPSPVRPAQRTPPLRRPARPADAHSPATTDATSHGNAAITDAARLDPAHHHLDRHAPGAIAHTNAIVAASIRPVGVSPASASQNRSGQTRRNRGALPVPATAAQAPVDRHPRQAAIAHQQAPMSLQKPLCDIGIPDRDRDGDALARDPGVGRPRRRQPRGPPARQPQTEDDERLDHDPAVDDRRRQRDREVLRQRPRRGLRTTQARHRKGTTAASTPRRAAAGSPAPAAAPSRPGSAPARTPAQPGSAAMARKTGRSDRSVRRQVGRPLRGEFLGLGLGARHRLPSSPLPKKPPPVSSRPGSISSRLRAQAERCRAARRRRAATRPSAVNVIGRMRPHSDTRSRSSCAAATWDSTVSSLDGHLVVDEGHLGLEGLAARSSGSRAPRS